MSGNTEPRRWTVERYAASESYAVIDGGAFPSFRTTVVEASAYFALAAENAALRVVLSDARLVLQEFAVGDDAGAAIARGQIRRIDATLANPVREQALTRLARDAQDAGAYDPAPAWTCRTCGIEDDQWEHECPDPMQAASHRHFGYAKAAEDAYQRHADAKNKETDA